MVVATVLEVFPQVHLLFFFEKKNVCKTLKRHGFHTQRQNFNGKSGNVLE